ncbi:ABC transporter permease subunit [Lysobacter sp. HA35]
MNALRIVAAICMADLRQRLRTPRTWVVLGALALATWWSFPPADAGYLTVWFGAGARAHYSSAWIGLVISLVYGGLLSLIGFYVVRGTVVRDFDTGTWQLLVSTPMNRAGYLFAKWLSHIAVFALMLAFGVVVGVVAQFVRGEVPHLDVVELLKPVVIVALPAFAFSATCAVWFDLLPWLRRSAGNVAYFFVWIFVMTGNVARGSGSWPGDPQGLLAVEQSLKRGAGLPTGFAKSGVSIGGESLQGKPLVLFDWTHWDVGMDVLAARGFWLALAVIVLLAATPLLDRCAARRGSARSRSTDGRSLRWLDGLMTPLGWSRFGALVSAEVRLALRPRRRLWFVAMLGIFIAQVFAKDLGLVAAILAGWLLSMELFSRAVLREHDTRTGALVFTASNMRNRLLAARVVVGIGMAWLVTLPALLRLGVQQPMAALAVAVAGVSIALWGLALGALFRNPRPFELVLIACAYVSVQGALVFNALTNPGAMLMGHAVALPLAAALLVGAWRPLVARVR